MSATLCAICGEIATHLYRTDDAHEPECRRCLVASLSDGNIDNELLLDGRDGLPVVFVSREYGPYLVVVPAQGSSSGADSITAPWPSAQAARDLDHQLADCGFRGVPREACRRLQALAQLCGRRAQLRRDLMLASITYRDGEQRRTLLLLCGLLADTSVPGLRGLVLHAVQQATIENGDDNETLDAIQVCIDAVDAAEVAR